MNINVALDLAIELITEAAQVAALIRRAREEDRPITHDELSELDAASDRARQRLRDAIDSARAGDSEP